LKNSRLRFYEKVIKVKADVAALHIFFFYEKVIKVKADVAALHIFFFYEKVIKVKADVAALHIFFSDHQRRYIRVAWRAVKGAVFWRSSRPLTAFRATSQSS
jgi:hypothetical protein